MQRPITRGAAANAGLIFHVFAQDSASTVGAGKASIGFASWACRYIRSGEAISGAITPEDIATIGTYAAPTANTNIRIKAVDNTNMIGIYEIQIHLDWVNVTNSCQSLTIYLTATGVAVLPVQIPLRALDVQTATQPVNLTQILDTALTETAGLLAGGFKKFFNVAAPTATCLGIPDAVPGATGGLPTTNGTKVNQTVDLTAGQSIAASSVPAVTLANGAHGGAATVITLQTPISATVPDTQKVDVETIKTRAVTCGAGVTVLASVGTAATNTAQTGDSYALANGAAGFVATKADTAAILLDTAEIGAAGAGLTALGDARLANLDAATSTRATPAQVNTEVVDALGTDTIPELAAGIPAATPTIKTALMLHYMALRNKMEIDAVANEKKIYNDAGNCIAKKSLADAANIYTESEAVSGP